MKSKHEIENDVRRCVRKIISFLFFGIVLVVYIGCWFISAITVLQIHLAFFGVFVAVVLWMWLIENFNFFEKEDDET